MSEHDVTLSDGVGTVGFTTLAYVDDNDYEWSVSAVLQRNSDGALFFAEDGGCSCYGFGDNITVADLKPIQKFEDALKLVDGLERERLQRSYDLNGETVYR